MRIILGWGGGDNMRFYRDNGKENGNDYDIIGL